MKKKWQKPIFEMLGVKNTSEDPITGYSINSPSEAPKGWTRVKCNSCGKVFESAAQYNNHKANGDGICDYTNSDSQDNVKYLFS